MQQTGGGLGQVDVDDFERFFNRMRPRLFTFARRWIDIDTANELAIQTLQVVWDKNLPAPTSSEATSRLESLAVKICEGLVRNELRGRSRRTKLLAAVASETATRTAAFPAVDQDLDAPEAVTAYLDVLPQGELEVIVLIIAGYRVSEIATMLGAKPGAISMRLRRARLALRKAMEGGSDGG